MKALKLIKQVTNVKTTLTDTNLQEIEKIEPISAADEANLVIRIKAGVKAALEKLTQAHQSYGVSVALAFQENGLSLSDLIHEGNLGLIKAAQRFYET